MRLAAALLACLSILATGCGGDKKKPGTTGGNGSQRSTAGDSKGAESTVRGYLRALVDKDGGDACDKLTPDYQKQVVDQNRDFARQNGVSDCAGLIGAVVKRTPSTTFEGQPLNKETVEKIRLRTTVRQNGKEQNATVAGRQGLQSFELFTTNGKWAISQIDQAGG